MTEAQRERRNQERARRRTALVGRRRLRAHGRLKEKKVPPRDGPISNRPGRHRRLDQAELWIYGEGVMEFSDSRSELIPTLRLFLQTDFARLLADETDAGRKPPEICGKPGRPRMHGRWEYLYLAYVLSQKTAMQNFYNRTITDELLRLCGFDHCPAYSELALRFKELEHKHWQAFRTTGQALVRFAKTKDEKVGDFWMVDGGEFLSNALLDHCCPDEQFCRAASARNHAKGRTDCPQHLPRLDDDLIKEIRASDLRTALPEELDSDWVPPSVVESLRIDGEFQYFNVNGHVYRSRDRECGLRKYSSGQSSYVHSWFGGSVLPAVDCRYGAPLAASAAAADEMEWDNLHDLFETVVEATGEVPIAVSGDALNGIRDWYEYLLRRGVMPVVPFRTRTNHRERESMRCDLYDEHHVPRCPGCGGEGIVDGREHGLFFTRSGEPVIRFRCSLPQTRACEGRHELPCETEWTMVTPLNQTHETYQAMRALHFGFERIFGNFRRRYSVGGKDKSSRLKRLGVEAQHLRVQAAVILDWFQIALRMGWISGGRKRFEGQERRYGGQGRAQRVLGTRVKRNLLTPYGQAWQRLKAERRTRRQAARGQPPPSASP
jgi:hypothetical protein